MCGPGLDGWLLPLVWERGVFDPEMKEKCSEGCRAFVPEGGWWVRATEAVCREFLLEGVLGARTVSSDYSSFSIVHSGLYSPIHVEVLFCKSILLLLLLPSMLEAQPSGRVL